MEVNNTKRHCAVTTAVDRLLLLSFINSTVLHELGVRLATAAAVAKYVSVLIKITDPRWRWPCLTHGSQYKFFLTYIDVTRSFLVLVATIYLKINTRYIVLLSWTLCLNSGYYVSFCFVRNPVLYRNNGSSCTQRVRILYLSTRLREKEAAWSTHR